MPQKDSFDHIAILFNPNSTGDAPRLAHELAKNIKKSSNIAVKPVLTPTKYRRHGEKLAEEISLRYKRPLIVSVSGDGGYNEVINGAMAAKQASRKAAPVVAVMGAGNANDHRRVTRDTPLLELIVRGEPKPMDLLHISVRDSLERHAHSYAGLGISPEVAVELNRHSLNFLRELQIIFGTFFRFTPFSVTHEGTTRKIDSLLFANINEMAKVLKLRDKLDVTDGRFEVIEFVHEGKLKLLYRLLRAALAGIKEPPQYKQYECVVADTNHIQLDGEVHEFKSGATVRVKSIRAAIDSLY